MRPVILIPKNPLKKYAFDTISLLELLMNSALLTLKYTNSHRPYPPIVFSKIVSVLPKKSLKFKFIISNFHIFCLFISKLMIKSLISKLRYSQCVFLFPFFRVVRYRSRVLKLSISNYSTLMSI